MISDIGIGKIVYGMEKVSSSAVELENGDTICKPIFLFGGDCRACVLLDLTCEELESPCSYLLGKCERLEIEKDCQKCEGLEECLGEKPCCWECQHLTECLEMAEDWGAEQFVKDVHGFEWAEFIVAVKLLASGGRVKEPGG